MSKTEWGKKCMLVHKHIAIQPEAYVFDSPVDAVAMGLHDYHTIITRPMDIGTVKKNMDSGIITSPDMFIDDMKLVFQNAMKYNHEDHEVHVWAKKLFFMIENKWDKESAAILKKFSGGEGGRGVAAPSTGKRLAEEPHDETAPFTFDEKRDLCASINKLPGKQLVRALSLIHEMAPKVVMQKGDDPDEIEIDLDKLETATLRHLDRMVREAHSKKKKRA
mmetsp:Transcript_61403/g.51938  ORF Transcript_61403/g.51938 Transcript_61403/m.51938 type:complete len:220 (+) Transcript_61403:96-755(+)